MLQLLNTVCWLILSTILSGLVFWTSFSQCCNFFSDWIKSPSEHAIESKKKKKRAKWNDVQWKKKSGNLFPSFLLLFGLWRSSPWKPIFFPLWFFSSLDGTPSLFLIFFTLISYFSHCNSTGGTVSPKAQWIPWPRICKFSLFFKQNVWRSADNQEKVMGYWISYTKIKLQIIKAASSNPEHWT